jgi:hypothetical protein
LAGLPGALEKAKTGEGLAPKPTTTGGKIAAGIGELAGFISGPAGGVTKQVAGALKPAMGFEKAGKFSLPGFRFAKDAGEKLFNVAMRSLATAGGLSTGYGVRNIGEALEEPTLTEAAKSTGQALSEGAGTGAIFGVAGHIPNRIARIAAGIGMLEAERSTGLNAPIFDDRPVEEKVFDIAQSIFFLWNKHGTPILADMENRVNGYAEKPTGESPVKLIEYAAKEWQAKEVVSQPWRTPGQREMGRGQQTTPEDVFITPDELKPITPQPLLQPRVEGRIQQPAALPQGLEGFKTIGKPFIPKEGSEFVLRPEAEARARRPAIGGPARLQHLESLPPVKPTLPGPAEVSAGAFGQEFATIQGPKEKELLQQRLRAEEGAKPSDSQVEPLPPAEKPAVTPKQAIPPTQKAGVAPEVEGVKEPWEMSKVEFTKNRWTNAGYTPEIDINKILEKHGLKGFDSKILDFYSGEGALPSDIPAEFSNRAHKLQLEGFVERKYTDKGPGELVEEGFPAVEVDRRVLSEKGKSAFDDVVAALDDAKENLSDKLEKHRESVQQALSENKPVPAEVLKDYPDLKPKTRPEVSQASPPAEEKIVSAAIRVEGTIYQGSSHPTIFDEIRETEKGKDSEIGFMTNTGRFIDRSEASRIAGIPETQFDITAEEIPELRGGKFKKPSLEKPKQAIPPTQKAGVAPEVEGVKKKWDGKERRKFFGIRDRVDRGLITKEMARSGSIPKSALFEETSASRVHANAADLAADYKAKGIERQASYSQFVRDRDLKPEMDAKEFYAIYDSVTPMLLKPKTPPVPRKSEKKEIVEAVRIESFPEKKAVPEPSVKTESVEAKAKEPWEMTSLYVATEKAKSDFPIKGKVEIENDKPIYKYSSKLKWGNGEKTLEIKTRNPLNGADQAQRLHREVIKQALSENKPVPAEVLKDYPDLQKPKPAEPKAPEKPKKAEVEAEPEAKPESTAKEIDVGEEVALPEELENILDRVTYEGGRFLEETVLNLPLKDRTKIDQWLVDTKHPLASEPGTQKDRIKSIAREIVTERKAEAKADAEAAKIKADAEAKDLAEYKHLEDVKVPVKGIREKTGDKITVRMNAKKALEKIDKDIELLNKIVECLE